MISVRASLGDWLCSEMAWRATELKKRPPENRAAASQGGTHPMVRATLSVFHSMCAPLAVA